MLSEQCLVTLWGEKQNKAKKGIHFRTFSFKNPLKYFINYLADDMIPFRETTGVNCRLHICELLFKKNILQTFPTSFENGKEEMSLKFSKKDPD